MNNFALLEVEEKLHLKFVFDINTIYYISNTVGDPEISKPGGRGPEPLEFLDLGFILISLHTYPMVLY